MSCCKPGWGMSSHEGPVGVQHHIVIVRSFPARTMNTSPKQICRFVLALGSCYRRGVSMVLIPSALGSCSLALTIYIRCALVKLESERSSVAGAGGVWRK